MTPKEKRWNVPESKARKMRRRRVRLLIEVGLLVLLSFCAFQVGKRVGIRAIKKMLQVSINENELRFDGDDAVEREPDSWANAICSSVNTVFANTDFAELILVNRDKPLPEDYEVELKYLPDGVHRAAKEAYEPLCDMLEAGQKEGLEFIICSSYRDVEYQKKLFYEDVEALMRRGYSYEKAYEEVAKETMPPGYSEHSTGLAFDIVACDYQLLDAGQEKTPENQWLQEHCAEYGFILRYPKDKEDITAINYESWHFRYVGKEAAEYIMEQGITLEEYLQELQKK